MLGTPSSHCNELESNIQQPNKKNLIVGYHLKQCVSFNCLIQNFVKKIDTEEIKHLAILLKSFHLCQLFWTCSAPRKLPSDSLICLPHSPLNDQKQLKSANRSCNERKWAIEILLKILNVFSSFVQTWNWYLMFIQVSGVFRHIFLVWQVVWFPI